MAASVERPRAAVKAFRAAEREGDGVRQAFAPISPPAPARAARTGRA